MGILGLDDDRSLDVRNTRALESIAGESSDPTKATLVDVCESLDEIRDAIKDLKNFYPITVPGQFRIKTDGTFQLWNADQLLFHSIRVTGEAGAESVMVEPGEL